MAFAEASITFMFVCEYLWCSMVVISAGGVTCLWASFCGATLVWVTCGSVCVVQPWCGLQLAIHILVGDFLWCNLGVGYNWLYTYSWASLCGATLVWVTYGSVCVVPPWCGLLVGQFVWCNLGVGYLWVSLCGATLVWVTTGYIYTYMWVSLCGATLVWVTIGYTHTCG